MIGTKSALRGNSWPKPCRAFELAVEFGRGYAGFGNRHELS